MDYVQEISSPLRIRSRMSILFWAVQLLAACAFLLLDVTFRIAVYIFLVPGAIVKYIFGIEPKPKPKPTNESMDLDRDFTELCESRGFKVQEHVVETPDGYILTLHRLLPKNYNADKYNGNYEALFEGSKPTDPTARKKAYFHVPSRGVVFFQHGFMMSSECWVFRRDNKQVLPFHLADQGYDVWFGNTRGNKYSLKHKSLSPTGDGFWNFCIDDLALKDLPAMLNYVLDNAGAEKITYIGFSQGTAIGFAAFSRYPELANRIKLFVALGPAARVKELRNQLVAAISTSRPQLIFLLFGRRALLNTAIFWRKVVPARTYVFIIDTALEFLFGWKTENIDDKEKALLYYHLYSTSSVKCLVHWFQITHSRRYQMFDDNIVVVNKGHRYKGYLLPRYDIRMIQCPMALFYGGRDTVPDHEWFLEDLKGIASFKKLESYEHLDFLYAKDAHRDVHREVIDLVNKHNQE